MTSTAVARWADTPRHPGKLTPAGMSILLAGLIALLSGCAGMRNTPAQPGLADSGNTAATRAPEPASAPRAESLPGFMGIVAENRNAVVNVATTQKIERPSRAAPGQLPPRHPSRRHDPQRQQRKHTSLGTGFIISPDGYVLTNAHVIARADTVIVQLADHRQLEARVVGVDRLSDIGLLKIDAQDLPTVAIGDSEKLRVGQWVLAIGAPFGLEYTATQGIVSALDRHLPNQTYTPFIQTDVAVNPGNSGGPLLDTDGRVVGVNSQIFSRTGGYIGLSFAVPINTAMSVAEALKTDGKVERGYLGVALQPVSRGLADSFGLDKPVGALVAAVEPDSPAQRAGLRPGDVILRLDDHEIVDAADLPPKVSRTAPGTLATLTLIRDGERMTLHVRLDELSEHLRLKERAPAGDDARQPQPTALNMLVRELSERERAKLNLGDRGLLVLRVGPGAAANAGLRPADILLQIAGEPVSEVEGLRQVLEAHPGGEAVPVRIRRGDGTLFLSMTLPEQR